jgi:hypothetical protein
MPLAAAIDGTLTPQTVMARFMRAIHAFSSFVPPHAPRFSKSPTKKPVRFLAPAFPYPD